MSTVHGPAPSPRAVHRELADGTGVILDLDSGAYFGLNETGALIWRLLDGTRDEEAVIRALHAELEDAPVDLDQHVRAFVAELHASNLLV